MDVSKMGANISMELKEDGKVIVDYDGREADISWEEKDGKWIIKEKQKSAIAGGMGDRNTVVEQDGGKMIFEKKMISFFSL